MCGIVGMLGRPVDPGLLAAMRDRLSHRGPDGEGLWLAPSGRIGLGHRRLAIVDLSAAAAQPMQSADGDVVIVYNGEIYNHVELRRQLDASGKHVWRTDHSDTEVLINGYREWGLAGLLERLDGMFAFALYDRAADELVLARDRVGVKPLYFAWIDGTFCFASEIKALASHPGLKRDVEPSALYHYLTFLVSPAPLTMFRGIFKLPAGWWIRVGPDGLRAAARWWDAVPGKSAAGRETADRSNRDRRAYFESGVRDRLDRAVAKRMMSDVPVGVFLSGGMDSSAILALMSRHADRPVNSFCVGFADHPEVNELEYARLAASKFGARHHEILVTDRDVTDYLETFVGQQDEPIADWVCLPLHFVAALARSHDVKVVQLGEGADEQFCGYGYYLRNLRLFQRYWRPFTSLPQPVRSACAALAGLAALAGPTGRLGRIADLAKRGAAGGELFWSGAPVFWEHEKRRLAAAQAFRREAAEGEPALLESGMLNAGLLQFDSANVVAAALKPFDASHPGRDQLTRMIHAEFRLRLPELLLMRVDKITMAHGLEARVPFLDPQLVDFTMDIPGDAKIPGNRPKDLLRSALRGLVPDAILDRSKRGFSAPMAAWLRGPLGLRIEAEVMRSRLLDRRFLAAGAVQTLLRDHRAGRADHALRIWTLFNLTAWYENWIEPGRPV